MFFSFFKSSHRPQDGTTSFCFSLRMNFIWAVNIWLLPVLSHVGSSQGETQ